MMTDPRNPGRQDRPRKNRTVAPSLDHLPPVGFNVLIGTLGSPDEVQERFASS
jgi:hypothetical protein